MSTIAHLLGQRCHGQVNLRMESDGIKILREDGSSKCRIPKGAAEAILINTAGGLAGGDRIDIAVEAGDGARLSLTTQAAERVYRSLGPAAEVTIKLSARRGSTIHWLPQETIFFEGSKLRRRLEVDIAEDASFIAAEAMVFGRHAMGECVREISFSDTWHVYRADKLAHVEALKIGPNLPASAATLGKARASATVLYIGPKSDQIAELLGPDDGYSIWNHKMVVRLLAEDGFSLRKKLIPLLSAAAGPLALPKCWMF